MTDLNPKEFKVVALRDCPVPESMLICETPDQAADYWRMHIATHPYFNPECECLAVLLLEHAQPGERTSACDHRHDGHDAGASARGVPGCGCRLRSGHRADAQPPFRRPDAERGRHQGDARSDSGRPTAENRSA